MSGMEGGTPKIENKKTFRVEHLPWADVVLNLDCSNKEDPEEVLDIIKNNGAPEGALAFAQVSFRENSNPKNFFLKTKNKTTLQQTIDVPLGRAGYDPVHPIARKDFSKEARYARASVLNEIILSPKIKRLVATPPFQELAKQFGFSRMEFAEPIAGVNEEYTKYLIYRNIKYSVTETAAFLGSLKIENLTAKLRKLFLQNNISPNDLRQTQLLISEAEGKRVLHLIDIEAYTEKQKSTGSPKKQRFFRW